MKQLLFLLFLYSSSVFSQSIDLGLLSLIQNKCVDKQKKELYVFYTDSVVVIDLVKLVKKSSNKLEYEEESNKEGLTEPVCINSNIYFVQNQGGLVFKLKNNKIVRIDKSFNHKMQINSSIFTYNDTIYRYGGYGFWSNRNFFTYFDRTTSQWEVVSPTGSKELPSGSQQSIVTIIGDDIFLYGGYTLKEFQPLNHIVNDEVWKFNIKTKSWERLGKTDFDLFNTSIKFSVKDDSGYFSNLENQDKLVVIDVLHNKKTYYKKTLFQSKLFGNPFYLDGLYYCFIWKPNSKGEIQLVTRNEDEFYGDKIREEKFYFNNEKIYLSIGTGVSLLLLLIVIFNLLKWNKKRNRIVIVNGHLVYKRRILNFDNKSIQIINLLLKSKKEVVSKDILDVMENRELNYGHNTRVMNLIINEINLKLKEILHINEDLISFEKSVSDKRIKVYSINKEYFFIKKTI